jgi:hypothetical protein
VKAPIAPDHIHPANEMMYFDESMQGQIDPGSAESNESIEFTPELFNGNHGNEIQTTM